MNKIITGDCIETAVGKLIEIIATQYTKQLPCRDDKVTELAADALEALTGTRQLAAARRWGAARENES